MKYWKFSFLREMGQCLSWSCIKWYKVRVSPVCIGLKLKIKSKSDIKMFFNGALLSKTMEETTLKIGITQVWVKWVCGNRMQVIRKKKKQYRGKKRAPKHSSTNGEKSQSY